MLPNDLGEQGDYPRTRTRCRATMSPRGSQGVPEADEEMPLLRDGDLLIKETPLPMTQILVLLLLQLSEPITSLSINPYIHEVRSPISPTQVVGTD
jgi:hypothetical protein